MSEETVQYQECSACRANRTALDERVNYLRHENSALGQSLVEAYDEIARHKDATIRARMDLDHAVLKWRAAEENLDLLIDSLPDDVCIPAEVVLYLNQR